MHGEEVVSVGWTVFASHKWCLALDAYAAQAVRDDFADTHNRVCLRQTPVVNRV